MAHIGYSKQILDSFYEQLEDVSVIDKPPKMEGRSMVMFLSQKTLVKFAWQRQAAFRRSHKTCKDRQEYLLLLRGRGMVIITVNIVASINIITS